ncbi:hypothetical protein [Megalodesulfovibrio paquesii]
MSLNPLRSEGYLILVGDFPGHNVFCGAHSIDGAICPNCRKPLYRFFSIQSFDPLLGIVSKNIKSVHILSCWRCNVAQYDFYYKLLPDGVRVLKYAAGFQASDFPYSNYPDFFPQAGMDFMPLTLTAQQMIINYNEDIITDDDLEDYGVSYGAEIHYPRHQIFGEPFLVYHPTNGMRCCKCNCIMHFLLSVSDYCLDPRGFTGNSYVQMLFFICVNCNIIGAYSQCD